METLEAIKELISELVSIDCKKIGSHEIVGYQLIQKMSYIQNKVEDNNN